jgi:ferric-dicitrate binding protein FerR (iron transport regulator)
MVTKPAPHFVIGPLVTGALGTAFTVKVTGALVVVHPETGSVAVAV